MSRQHGPRVVCIIEGKRYKPGDLPPSDYLGWHEWAEVQRKAGIKPALCAKGCGRWITPQEIPSHRCKVTR
jgi:hypothetical protein